MTDHLANAGNPIPTLELVEALENAQAELLRSKAHAEMRRMDDEALLRQALEALEYYRSGEDYQPTPASEAIAALKARLK